MKRLIAVAVLLVGMTGFAQEKISNNEGEKTKNPKERLTLEQRKQLQLKKMTLELDLTPSQQKEMATIITEKQLQSKAKREAFKTKKQDGKKLTADEIFVMKNKELDDEIASKAKVKKVLTPEQFEKWEQVKKKDPKKRMTRHLSKKTVRQENKK